METYHRIERQFFKKISAKFSDILELYCVTGGLAYNEIYPGWSDTDVLIVLNHFQEDSFKTIGKIMRENKSGIKIGITIYSLQEFNAFLYKVPKTYHSINLILKKKLKPRVMTKRIALKHFHRIEVFDDVDVSHAIHSIKREVMIGPTLFDENKIYKSMILIFKVYLRNRGIYTEGYGQTLKMIDKNFKLNFKIYTPEEIVKYIKKEDRYPEYVKFIQWIGNHRYWNNPFVLVDKHDDLLLYRDNTKTSRSKAMDRRVRAVIVENGRLLTIRRFKPDKEKAFWVFPGGGCKAGENDIQALQREIKEELNVEVQVLDRFATYLFESPEKGPQTEIFYQCRITQRPSEIRYLNKKKNGTYDVDWLAIANIKDDMLLEPFDIRDKILAGGLR